MPRSPFHLLVSRPCTPMDSSPLQSDDLSLVAVHWRVPVHPVPDGIPLRIVSVGKHTDPAIFTLPPDRYCSCGVSF